MRSPRFLIGWPLVAVLLLLPSAPLAADIPKGSASPSIVAQPPNNGADQHLLSAQPSDSMSPRAGERQPADKALEISPQPQASNKAPAPDNRENPEERAFRQSREAEIATLNRNFDPHDPDDNHHRPYLGFDLEYTTQCYLGMEEHGLEVVNVYPNSPAARAGLIGRTGSTPIGDLSALGSVLLLPIAPVVFPLLRKSGALGTDGDLIVAVDDMRVRNESEMLSALGRIKAGDTAYITVIRPLIGGSHRTMRIKVHIDYETDANGKIINPPGSPPGAAAIGSTETAAN
jgi:S1-C subfamily serine protease